MLSRRLLVFGLAVSACLPSAAFGRDIGVRGLAQLWPALGSMHSIDMGAGPKLYVVVAPGCSAAGTMWEGAVKASERCTIGWIPVGSGYDADEAEVSRCLANGTPEAVRQLLAGPVLEEATPAGNAMAADQRRLYGRTVERLMWESTGRAPAVPTLVFLDRAAKVRVVRGAIPIERFEEVLSAMGA